MSWETWGYSPSAGAPEPGDVVYDDDTDELLYVTQVEWDEDGGRMWAAHGKEDRRVSLSLELVQDCYERVGGVL